MTRQFEVRLARKSLLERIRSFLLGGEGTIAYQQGDGIFLGEKFLDAAFRHARWTGLSFNQAIAGILTHEGIHYTLGKLFQDDTSHRFDLAVQLTGHDLRMGI